MNDGQDAVTSTYAFIIAVGIMLTSIATVYQATDSVVSLGTVQETQQVNLQSEAAALKDIILGSPGVVTGGGPWDETTLSADEIVRLGLLDPNGNGIQVEKLRNLRLAPRDANPTDDFANYDEVRTALGLDDKGLDFHIRAKPTLESAAEVADDSNLRDKSLKVTYIGNVASVASGNGSIDDDLVVSNFACTASPAGGPSYRFSVNITNGGTVPTQFFAVFDIENSRTITRQDQTSILAAGATESLYVDVENTSDVDCDADTTAEIDILDPIQLLRSEIVSSPTIGTAPASTTDDKEFYLAVGNPYHTTSDSISLGYFGDEKGGDTVTLTIREGTDPAGTTKAVDNITKSHVVPGAKKDRSLEFSASSLGEGNFTAYLTHVQSGVTATQRIIVENTPIEAYTPASAGATSSYEEDPAIAIEVGFLNTLAENFCPTYYNNDGYSPIGESWSDRCADFKTGHDQPGDIFPDLQKELWEMADRLVDSNGTPRYDIVNTVVVGSNVAHNSMTSNNFGDPLEAWVLGGGTLIVFGSPGQSTQWLQNLFHAGQASSSGGISAPDVSHPLLATPEFLDYEEYATSDKGWKYTGGADEHFTDVVQQGGTPITAISDPGDFGEGTIVLTSWLPYDLFGTGTGTSSDEGLRLMQNFLMQSYRDLFLDYGPPLPDGASAIPAIGVSFVNHEDLGPLTMEFVLFVFKSSG